MASSCLLCLSELGIFGYVIGDKTRILTNKQVRQAEILPAAVHLTCLSPLSPDWPHTPDQVEPRGRGRGLCGAGGPGLCVPGPGPDLHIREDSGRREGRVRGQIILISLLRLINNLSKTVKNKPLYRIMSPSD